MDHRGSEVETVYGPGAASNVGGAVVIDFYGATYQTWSIDTATTFTTANRVLGHSVTLVLIADGDQGLTFPSEWTVVGPALPTTIGDGLKVMIALSVTASGGSDYSVIAAGAAQA